MKKIISLRVAILIVVIISFAVCKKQETEILKPFVNTAPVADAGNDTTIIYPANSVVLDGSNSTDKENNIVNYSWKKISEPLNNDIYIYFQQRESGKALVQNLENKIYQFELTVTDQWGGLKRYHHGFGNCRTT